MSLLDEFNDTDKAATFEEREDTEESEASDSPPSWYWDENTPGVGERPAYLPEKYKTVADMAKAQRELESRLGQAPKEYDFSKGDKWIEPEYEPFKKMAELAKSKHVPQEVMDAFMEATGSYLDEFKVDVNAEKQKLGANAGERLSVLNNWAKANLSEKAYATLTRGMKTAESIEALEELRTKMLANNTMIPTGKEVNEQAGPSLEEYRVELAQNLKKYQDDPVYRKAMEQKLAQIVGRPS